MSAVRILILRGGAIGDFVLTIPAISAVRDRWPEAYIEVIGYPWIAALARAGGLVDKVVSLDKAEMASYFALRAHLTEEQKSYIRSFDFVISYLHDPAATVRGNMVSAGVRQFIYGSPIVNEGHAIEHLMKPLEELAIYPEQEPCPSIALSEECLRQGQDRMSRIGECVLAIHPGSGSPKKNWPLDRFVELAGMVSGRGATPMFVIGRAEVEIHRELSAMGNEVPVLHGCSVVELAEALSACVGYVGNDSGVTHIAAALGLPTVALFGPTDPAVWGPRGRNVRVLTSPEKTTESLACLRSADVLECLEEVAGWRGG